MCEILPVSIATPSKTAVHISFVTIAKNLKEVGTMSRIGLFNGATLHRCTVALMQRSRNEPCDDNKEQRSRDEVKPSLSKAVPTSLEQCKTHPYYPCLYAFWYSIPTFHSMFL